MSEQTRFHEQADALYERYGKRFEHTRWGDYVAISTDGRTIVASTPLAAAQEAVRTLGRGCFLFKVGDRAVATWK